MNEATIITLNNGNKYEILMESELENKKYYLASEVNGANEEIDNYCFFAVNYKNGNETLCLIKDQTLIEELTVLFTVKYSQLADSLGGNN